MENSCIMGFQKPDVELLASQNLQGACRSMVPPWIPDKEEDYCQCAWDPQSDLVSAQVTRDISTTDGGSTASQSHNGIRADQLSRKPGGGASPSLGSGQCGPAVTVRPIIHPRVM